jgi:hypothetical protein
MAARYPITLPVIVELGGSMSAALSALASYPRHTAGNSFGLEACRFARRPFRSRGCQALGHLLNHISIFEAWVDIVDGS